MPVSAPDEAVPPTEATPREERPVLMAQPPKTGDLSALFLGLSGLSGAGLIGVSLTGRKKREQE